MRYLHWFLSPLWLGFVALLFLGYGLLVLMTRLFGERHIYCQRCEQPFEKPQHTAFCKRCWAVIR